MSKWKRRLLVTVGILLVIAVVSIPSMLLLSRLSDESRQGKQQELLLAFAQRYGPLATLIEIAEPQNFYIYVWEMREGEVTIRHFTLSINGLFVELGQLEIFD